MSRIAAEDHCDGWCCEECGAALEYDSESDWDSWFQWCFCPAGHGQVDDEDAVACGSSER